MITSFELYIFNPVSVIFFSLLNIEITVRADWSKQKLHFLGSYCPFELRLWFLHVHLVLLSNLCLYFFYILQKCFASYNLLYVRQSVWYQFVFMLIFRSRWVGRWGWVSVFFFFRSQVWYSGRCGGSWMVCVCVCVGGGDWEGWNYG